MGWNFLRYLKESFGFSAPNDKMAEVLKKTVKEAKDMISKVNYNKLYRWNNNQTCIGNVTILEQ